MLGLDRSRRAGRWLEWKVRIFTAGAILAVAGMYLEERWMTGAAIVVLLGGVFLRFLPGVDGEGPEEDGDDREVGPGVRPDLGGTEDGPGGRGAS